LLDRAVVRGLRCLEAERAHRLSLRLLRSGLAPRRATGEPILATHCLGLSFANPLGIAAGYDKNAEVPEALARLGFGFVEVGTVTPRPQAGNPRPRLFRLPEDGALINRLGFNNDGLDSVVRRLSTLPRPLGVPLGVNVGANRDSTDPIADYVTGLERVAPFADYVMVNVSSPNTPGLRDLQMRSRLEDLLRRLNAARGACRPPLVLKIAPDLDEAGLSDVAEAVLAHGIDAVAIGNTTIGRPAGLRSLRQSEAGGLSGRPLFALSTAVLTRFHRLTQGRVPLIGIGGIDSADTAYAKLRAGASLLQLYTGLVYGGPGLIGQILEGLATRLARDGFRQLKQAVGANG